MTANDATDLKSGLTLAVLLLAASGIPAYAQSTTLGAPDVPRIVSAALAHATPHYAGQVLQITAPFAHIDHHDDYAAGARSDNARSFEVIVTGPQMPAGIDTIYVSCLLPASHPFAKLADMFPLGQDAREFSGRFALGGAIAEVDYDLNARDATITLRRDCIVREAK